MTERVTALTSSIRRTRTSAAFAVIAACLALLLLPSPAVADPHDDQARVEHELATTKAALEASSDRVAQAGAAFAEANLRLPEVERQLADARGMLAGARASAATAERVAQKAALDLVAADKALVAAGARVEATREDIGRYAAQAYMGRDIVGVQALLSVQDPADFVAGLTYMEQVAGVERQTLDRHTQAQAEAKASQNEQALRKRAAEESKRQADEALRAAQAAEAEAATAEQEVSALVAQRQQALTVAEEERGANQTRLAELQAESDRIAADIRALASGTAPGGSGQVIRSGARLPMPVHGRKSSDFGTRYDPFYRVWQLHAGVDFAAAGGTPIWAAQSGNVFRAGWSGGYGNYTCVYHGTYEGKGFATCYAHQSAILVHVGQQVRQGEVIGRVGTTGASTGNHLHFEVRLDGTPVDPVPWLPTCLC
jgi:murein DD-endopeptidase MepM/ murein hydrolase activator NlpD